MAVLSLFDITDCERSAPICDWLDVTCAPNASFVDDLTAWLLLNGVACITFKDGSNAYTFDRGVLQISTSAKFHRASASGGFVDGLRDAGLFRDYVNLLGSVPHKVTRLDVAVDVSVDAPLVLDALESTYPDGVFHFGRKAVRTKTILEKRMSDNLSSGTWYAGHRSKARLTGRVYDKQLELMEKHGILSPPMTRFELTFRKDFGASLWDVLSPTDIFYSYAGNLMKTDHVKHDDWSSRGTMPWNSLPVDKDMTIERFKRMLAHSAELKRYCAVASSSFGAEGEPVVLSALQDVIHDLITNSASTSEGDSEA